MSVDPAQLAELLQGMGGGGAPPADPQGGDWLTTAINAIHAGMVEDKDPKTVSLLGTILDKITTYQALKAAPSQGQAGG